MTLIKLARHLNASGTARRRLPGLLLMTDGERLPDPLPAVRRLPPGAGVILRHYDAPDRSDLAARLAEICRGRGLPLLIAGDWRLAMRVGAAGLHLPEAMVSTRTAWCRGRPDWLITAAAHSVNAIRRAQRSGVDAVLVSPVFGTASHPGARTIGRVRFAKMVRESALPVFALGGIGNANAAGLKNSGAVGIAAISALATARRL